MKTNSRFGTIVFSSLIMLNTLMVWKTTAQDRGSVWVHGLNSSGDNWSKWEQLFTQERKMFDRTYRGQPYTYNTTGGVQNAALSVRYSYTPDTRTIYFGHSMGGVIGREVDVSYPNSVGGFVSFGSPFDGANIANSVRNGAANSFISDGVNKVTRGPSRQLGPVVYIIWNLVVDDVVRSIQDKLTNVYSQNDQGITDLQEGSSYLQSGIRNSQTVTPKIHVYGNEQSPVLWRYASAANEYSNGRPAFNDTYFVDFANTAGDVYEAAMWINYGAAAATGWFTFGIGAIYFYWVGNGWMDGKNWWRYDSESGWNSLIGANTSSYKTVTYTNFNYNLFSQCLYNSGGYGSSYYPNRYQQCAAQAQVTTTYYYYSPVNGQSDAFIKAPSQTGYNSAWSNNATIIEAFGVNHIEMLDNPKVGSIMNSIFDGTDSRIDRFFITNRR